MVDPSGSQNDVEVAQKLNTARLLQTVNEAILTASNPPYAALQVVRLYTLLAPVRLIDADFEDDWNQVLRGNLPKIVGYYRGLARLRWTHINAAHEVLLRLMERHGMGFQAMLQDEVQNHLDELARKATTKSRGVRA
jgi:hypothetical protein